MTSVDNAVLLCVFHHKEVHRFELSIERIAASTTSVARALGSGSSPPRYVFRLPDGTVVPRVGSEADNLARHDAPSLLLVG